MSGAAIPGTDCAIIGSGIVAICTALYLQDAGAKVVVFDDGAPEKMATYGNAGILHARNLSPLATGKTLLGLPKLLLDPKSPLIMRWSRLGSMSAWFAQLLKYAQPAHVEKSATAISKLAIASASAYEPLLEEAGAEHLVGREGWLGLYGSEASFAGASSEIERLRRLGATIDVLSEADVARRLPELKRPYAKGVLYRDAWHTRNPAALRSRFVDLFEKRGGLLVRERISEFQRDGSKVTGVVSAGGRYPAGMVVVAAGSGSAQFTTMAGERVPHQAVGGYHVMLHGASLRLDSSVLPMDLRFSITPMEDGIRLAGFFEFGGEATSPRWRYPRRMLDHAQSMFPTMTYTRREFWRGFRSTLPDTLPIIGPSKTLDNLFYVFGHSSMGMITAAISGKCIADLWSGGKPAIQLEPFSIDRFR